MTTRCISVILNFACETEIPYILDNVNQSLATEIRDYERMDLVGQLSIQGNLPCLTCGEGDECEMSAVKLMYGPNAKTSDYDYSKVENQSQVWEEANRIGRMIGKQIHKKYSTFLA